MKAHIIQIYKMSVCASQGPLIYYYLGMTDNDTDHIFPFKMMHKVSNQCEDSEIFFILSVKEGCMY